jgi:hypothetical protein
MVLAGPVLLWDKHTTMEKDPNLNDEPGIIANLHPDRVRLSAELGPSLK